MEQASGRELIEGLFTEGKLALDPEQEHEIRHPDYVMEMPQSGERIRGRDKMREMQEAFPRPPVGQLRRVTGAGDIWVAEGTNEYAPGDLWYWVMVIELQDGKIRRETRYYGQPFEAPEWRSAWVEPMSDG